MNDDNPKVLPGKCTEISTQKNKRERVSLFIDGEFFGGFNQLVIRKAGIRKGDLITEQTGRELLRQERKFRLRDQIYRWLSIRNHSTGEIRIKCRQKGYSAEEAEEITLELLDKGVLDDALFARLYSENKAKSKAWGPVKIRLSLSQKGVEKQYIDKAMETLFPDGADDDLLIDAARSAKKRLMRVEAGFRRKKKLADYLIRRGFPGNQVFEKVDDLLKKLENEET